MRHEFTKNIESILSHYYSINSAELLKTSELLSYINIKTKSANRGSKARGSFGNIYAIYCLVEDYINNGFLENNQYKNYEGAIWSNLFNRQRELPFGSKLQNHAFNHRLNQEYKKYFPNSEFQPIIRDIETKRYWINENLLRIDVNNQNINLALAIKEIIEKYIKTKTLAFESFIKTCEEIYAIDNYENVEQLNLFISSLLEPQVDARIFEVVSFCILKYFYKETIIYFGYSLDSLEEEELKLYKTGRTNANDGGIDFVMKPLGRFFQVTESTDVKKYFLDIDKLEKYPITFVIKSELPIDTLIKRIKIQAEEQFMIQSIIEKYMNCIEEIINIPILKKYLNEVVINGSVGDLMREIVVQSKVEFNYN